MKISVATSVSEVAYHDLGNSVAVIIDVLRATSVITTALENGAAAIYPTMEIEEAQNLAGQWSADEVMLAGERNSLMIPGFNLGNSPLEFTRDRIAGKRIVMTTSNGTRALHAAKTAQQVFIGCLLNAAAVARVLHDWDEVVIICAGTHNRLDISDCMAAGAIIQALHEQGMAPEVNDLGLMCADYFSPQTCERRIRESWHGTRLLQLGMEEDLRYCCRLNTSDTVAMFDGEKISAYR